MLLTKLNQNLRCALFTHLADSVIWGTLKTTKIVASLVDCIRHRERFLVGHPLALLTVSDLYHYFKPHSRSIVRQISKNNQQ